MALFIHFEVEVICVGLLIFNEMPLTLAEHEDSKPQIPWTLSVNDPEPVLFSPHPHIVMSPNCLLL
jgi:hypothetical protein